MGTLIFKANKSATDPAWGLPSPPIVEKKHVVSLCPMAMMTMMVVMVMMRKMKEEGGGGEGGAEEEI